MGQDHLPLFPLDSALLPGARKRVQLAARLDEMLRSSTKQKAEKTWEQQMAEAAGIMLSDDEGSEEEAETRQPQAAKALKLQQVSFLLFQDHRGILNMLGLNYLLLYPFLRSIRVLFFCNSEPPGYQLTRQADTTRAFQYPDDQGTDQMDVAGAS